MKPIAFIDIPKHYRDMIDDISEPTIKNVFSKFEIKYFPFETIRKQNNSENPENEQNQTTPISSRTNDDQNYVDFLFQHLKNFKFLTFDINKQRIQDKHTLTQDKYNFIVCHENYCLIIEEISKDNIIKIIEQLNKEQISLINASSNLDILKSDIFCPLNEEIQEEINKFCVYFHTKHFNDIIKYLLRSMIGYLIRRYFYPSDYFKDPSFFTFNGQKISDEETIKKRIKQSLEEELKEKRISKIIKQIIMEINLSKKSEVERNFYNDFEENNFITLRTVASKKDVFFNLVIHKETLYIFMMKKVIGGDIQHEKEFCEKYSHRCMTHFYGFLKKDNNIIGFIYEFQSNGPLSSYKHNNELFSIITIIRLYECLEYLQSKSLIHRDLKPSNILINHDNLPFISDFETIRSANIQKDEPMTNDIGSILYSSPELDKGENISYATDIYSFGLIIYFLKENKDMFESYESKLEGKIKPITKCSPNIQIIYERCIQQKQSKRMNISEIKKYLNNEINSFIYYEEYFIQKMNNENNSITQIIDFIFEQITTYYKLLFCQRRFLFFFIYFR